MCIRDRLLPNPEDITTFEETPLIPVENQISRNKSSRKSKKKNVDKVSQQDTAVQEKKASKVILQPIPNLSTPTLLLKNCNQIGQIENESICNPANVSYALLNSQTVSHTNDKNEETYIPSQPTSSLSSVLENMTDSSEANSMSLSKELKQEVPSMNLDLLFKDAESIKKHVTELRKKSSKINLKSRSELDKPATTLTPEAINLLNVEFKYKNENKNQTVPILSLIHISEPTRPY